MKACASLRVAVLILLYTQLTLKSLKVGYLLLLYNVKESVDQFVAQVYLEPGGNNVIP